MLAWKYLVVHLISAVVAVLCRSKGVRLRLFISKHIHLLIKLILCIYFVYVSRSPSLLILSPLSSCLPHTVTRTHMIWNWRCRVVVCPVFNRKSFESFSLSRCKAGLQSTNVSLMWCFYLLIYLNCHLFENVYLSLFTDTFLSHFMPLPMIITSLPLHASLFSCSNSQAHIFNSVASYLIHLRRACVVYREFEWETFLS